MEGGRGGEAAIIIIMVVKFFVMVADIVDSPSDQVIRTGLQG